MTFSDQHDILVAVMMTPGHNSAVSFSLRKLLSTIVPTGNAAFVQNRTVEKCVESWECYGIHFLG